MFAAVAYLECGDGTEDWDVAATFDKMSEAIQFITEAEGNETQPGVTWLVEAYTPPAPPPHNISFEEWKQKNGY